MGLDISKLEKVRHRGSNTIARCPACAESGGDRKGEHLLINDAGQFGCALFPGQSGQQHRQRIFELAGVNPSTLPGLSLDSARDGSRGMVSSVEPKAGACSGLTLSEVEWVKETQGKSFEVRKPLSTPAGASVIQKDILGHLGRIPPTHARKSFESHLNEKEYKAQEESTDSVPSVPEPEQDSLDELGPRPF